MRSRISMLSALVAALSTSKYTTCRDKPARPCLHCGKAHTHNNCYCSAECCREYRRRARA